MAYTRVRRTRQKSVTVRVEVHARVVEGEVSEEELTLWIAEALARHHTFRAGFIGADMCGIEKPFVVPEIPY